LKIFLYSVQNAWYGGWLKLLADQSEFKQKLLKTGENERRSTVASPLKG
jgi:hypothetical protein